MAGAGVRHDGVRIGKAWIPASAGMTPEFCHILELFPGDVLPHGLCVIPAKAGIHLRAGLLPRVGKAWIPAFAGMIFGPVRQFDFLA
jgi:hypothetical protein